MASPNGNPSSHLSFVDQNLEAVPEDIPASATSLDFSHNQIRDVSNLKDLHDLESLVLDNNMLDSSVLFPSLPKVKTLWVNSNNIEDLESFIENIKETMPNLVYLSMLKNPACPNYFTDRTQEEYRRYRLYVIHHLQRLKYLDSSPITPQARKEAERLGQYLKIAKPDATQRQAKLASFPVDETKQLPQNIREPGSKGRTSFGVTRYVYHGRHSEGNRFILDQDL